METMTKSDIGLRSERGPILLAVMVATGVVAIDATIISTAVTSITDDIGGFPQFPWLFSVYLLAQSVTVPVYSKLADTIGRKRVILFGIAVFLLGSILCGVAWDMPSLIAFRAVQGIGAGAILPITITIIGDIYSLEERARVQGYVASVWAVAAVAGPTLGGLFAGWDLWRGIFLINIPLCLIAFWLLARDYHERLEPRRHRIDYAGAVLMTGAFTLLLLGVLEGGNAWEWASPPSFAVFGGGVVLLVAFVLVERRAAEPVLPLWVLTRPLLRATNLVGLAVGAALIGLTAFVPTYLVIGLGVSPLVAGLALATLTIGWPISAALSGRLYLRIGFRSTAVIGATLVVLGVAALAVFGLTPSVWMVALLSFVIGLGFGFAAVPTLVAAQSSVGWDERGVVTGVSMFSRSIGQSIGAAILGAVANAVIAGLGGDEGDPGTIIRASDAVFVGAAIIAVLLLVGAVSMPRERRAPASDPVPPATDPIPEVG
ncbi:MFS transporter [Protaetiibacter intestinalis]|uniref:MFS transporter n=1 Tax=Protaetiibacter intestinalis TaxID=2419774 RepID=A0A387B7T7_9MICO|nr:MFS transporter [Protaetiibacter intestinalis]AYF98417.1 MFS transporter [Protaetiibacter intestinalis]